VTYVGCKDTLCAGDLVRFGPEVRQGYSPVSKHSWISVVQTHRPISTRTDDVDVRVGPSGAIVVVAEGESINILVGELRLRADPSEAPGGVGPMWAHEHHCIVWASGCLLGDDGLGVDEAVLLDGRNVGVSPQNLQVSVGEGSSKTVDNIPFLRNLGLGADLAGNGGDASETANIVLEGHDVMSSNSVLGLFDGDEGGGSSEDGENTEGESDELLGEHGGCLELWDVGFKE